MGRLKNCLSRSEQLEIGEYFSKTMSIAKTIRVTNSILIQRAIKPTEKEGMVTFLIEIFPQTYAIFREKNAHRGRFRKAIVTKIVEPIKKIRIEPHCIDPWDFEDKGHPRRRLLDEPRGMRPQTVDEPEPYRNKAFDEAVYKELVLDKEKERKRKKDSQ